MAIHEPVRPKVNQPAPRRKCSVFYYLPFNNDRIRVCKQTLIHTYSITSRRLQWLTDKVKNRAEIADKRGCHFNRPRSVPEDTKEVIREHINSFPKQESHYSRGKSTKEYLSENLNLTKMYKLFLEKYPEKKISARTYRAEFVKFRLRFGAPRSDTCTVCDRILSCAQQKQRNSEPRSSKKQPSTK